MEYHVINKKSYNIHTLKNNRFKTTRIEVIFRLNVNKDNIYLYTFLCDLLNYSYKECPTKRDMNLKAKDLYNTFFSFNSIVLGSSLTVYASTSFINPEYIDEKDYLDKVIKTFFSFILKPNVTNREFDQTSFNVVKNNILIDIDAIEENPNRKAMRNAFNLMDKDSITSAYKLGKRVDVERITPSSIYEVYENLINNAVVDIFVSGSTDLDNVTFLIDKYYDNKNIRDGKFNYFIENKEVFKIKKKKDIDKFDQSQLLMLYNVNNVTKYERDIVFVVLNYILGNGGLRSKIYRYVREDNSLCYRISSMYLKFDSLLFISSSLVYENVEKTITLVDKAIKEMKKGIFTEEDIDDAKKNLLMSININLKNPNSILDNMEMNYFMDTYLLEEKKELISKVTKEDIIKLAKKIRANTYYCLQEVNNERN